MNKYPVSHNNKNKEKNIIRTTITHKTPYNKSKNSLEQIIHKKENGPPFPFSDPKLELLLNYLRILKLVSHIEQKITSDTY
jgi:hypothetical protein